MIQGIVVRENGAAIEEFDESFIPDGDVLVDVAWSDLNYKDGLAVTGRPGVVRTTPLVAGIDLVGTVVESTSPRWGVGDTLILNGAGLSETKHGGYATRARIDGEHAVAVPDGLTAEQCAALGTAGYTAALAVMRIVSEGLTPADGAVLVTGATGGVGSIATMLLATAGFRVVAATGRVEEHGDYLRDLGAAELIDRTTLSEAGRPLQKATWCAVVDSVGGEMLANAIARTSPGGVVAACGLAGSSSLPTTVMPFILRGVTLAGIDSVWAPLDDRADAWRLLARGIDTDRLDEMTTTIGLDGVIAAGGELLAGRRHGRTLVELS